MSKFIDEIKVPTEIKENEKDLYHVIIVEGEFNKTTLEANYSSRVQIYNDRSWTTIKDRLKQIGYTNVYVLHDPTIKAEKVETGTSGDDTGAKKGESTKTDKGTDAGDKGDAGEKITRQELIAKAKELGFEGALNLKNEVYEEFIKNAETNGEGAE